MLRAFWLFLGVAASMIAGLLIQVLANIAFIVTMGFFIAAWICVMIGLFRFVQYGFARRGLSNRMSQDLLLDRLEERPGMERVSSFEDPLDRRDDAARWGLRGFWLFGGVAASVLIGYVLLPGLAKIGFAVAMVFFVAAWLCLLMMIFRLIQYGLARRAYRVHMSQDLGTRASAGLPKMPSATWWNRLSPFGKSIYLLGGFVFALVVAMAKPNMGDANFGARALEFAFLIGIFTFGTRVISRR